MIIGMISDLHGELVSIPDEIELLLITGDILCHSSPKQYNLHKELAYLNKIFAPFIERQMKNKTVQIVWGNHDLIAERDFRLMPQILQDISLINQSVVHNGIKIYGTPYQPFFQNWAFNRQDTPDSLGQIYSLIPDDTDILMTHCPPYGILDQNQDGEHCGSRMLAARIANVPPKLCCFGHIHHSRGVKYIANGIGNTTFVNASIMDDKYIITNEPIVMEWKK